MENPQPDTEFKPLTPEIDAPLTDGVESYSPADTAETETIRVQEAINNIEKRDPIDVYARRLNGTAVLGTRSITTLAAPTTLTTLMANSIYSGGAIAAVTAGTAGAVAAGAAYGLHRATEKRRAEKAEDNQQIIRDALGEPVDIMRSNDGKGLVIRWYGADEQYGNPKDPSVPIRLEKIVKFAEDNNLNKIVTSADITTVDGEIDTSIETTTSRELLSRIKKQSIDDFKADKLLAELTTVQAREILDRLKSQNIVTKTEAIADWLVSIKPSHPLRQILETWKRMERPEALLPEMKRILRGGLERHFTSDRLPETVLSGVHRIKTESAATVTPNGVHFTDMPTKLLPDQPQVVSSQHIPFSRLVAGGDMGKFVDGLLEQRDKPTKPVETWQLELGIYHLLTANNQSQTAAPIKQRTESSGGETETLFQRMLKEPPKTNAIRPGLRKRGAVDEANQTIEYKRRSSNWSKKISATIIALAMGYTGGQAWSEAWTKAEISHDCDPADANIRAATPEQEVCSPADKFYDILSHAASSITSGTATWEDKVIAKAYELGIINAENYNDILNFPDETPKPVQPQNLSMVGDSEQGSTDEILWTLEPLNNASTSGYWYTGIQNSIELDSSEASSLAPYADLTMSYKNINYDDSEFTTDTTLPPYFGVEHMRELDIPSAPTSTDQDLIKVSGEMSRIPGNTLTEATASGESIDWNALVLPVIGDGDIVAAEITFYDPNTGEAIKDRDYKIIQKNDGTFNLLSNGPSNERVEINYWVDPNATTDILLHATQQPSVQDSNGYQVPLSDALSQDDVTEILALLGLPPDASASQVAQAIKESDTYSYTPYQDANAIGTIELDLDSTPSDEILVNIAEEAINLDSSNCNIAFSIGLIASRGVEGDGYINGATGYREDGNGLLTVSELHQWGITDTGVVIDGTPAGTVETPPIDDSEIKAESNRQKLNLLTQLAGGILAMVVSAAATRRLSPRVEKAIYQSQTNSALKWLEDPKRSEQLNNATATLRHFVYARPDSPLPATLLTNNSQPITDQMANLPPLSRKQLRAVFKERAGRQQPLDRGVQRTIRQATSKYRVLGRNSKR